ncbi:MAG: hypothetical protein MRY77_14545 [Rhodobacteraceae bacterium]|nr:hypothetical protein [Paracoccaceae bacterium]
MLVHLLVWLTALDRETDEVHRIGFWTGADHTEFTINGETRTYYGAGSILEVDPVKLSTGLEVRTQRVRFSQVAPELLQAVRLYDPRHQPLEVHRAFFDPLSELLIDAPVQCLSGFTDRIRVNTPAEGRDGSIELTIATAARALTRALGRKRSHASLSGRSPDDKFRQYASMAERVEVKWGRG